MLEVGHTYSKEATILNIIEWMSTLEWYNAKFEQAKKAPPPIKQRILRKHLAIIVLDKYLKEVHNTIVVENLGKLTLKDNKDHPLLLNSARIQKRIFNTRKKRLNNIFYRG